MNPYLGHESQLHRVEEYRLMGGKGDGMRLLEIDNGCGLQMTLSLDRCCDISRLSYKGMNMGFFAPCGYVAPAYYNGKDFLKAFTAGFLTTCGLEAVGGPCVDAGEELPQHGSISFMPASRYWWEMNEEEIRIHAVMEDAWIFARKLTMERTVIVSLKKGSFQIVDDIRNDGDKEEPLEILYHMNMGYPLLDEDSVLSIANDGKVTARSQNARDHIDTWNQIEKPQPQYQERCYYHAMPKEGKAALWQPKHKKGILLTWDKDNLDCFTQWKMMGIRDYVLGLEPGNCYPNGRKEMREKGILKFIQPGQTVRYALQIDCITNWEE
ncbi:MAG: DUF4432 family protein [Clostridiales bacterium]|nr:DUF4432 family protein [Clostridiales bacterium]